MAKALGISERRGYVRFEAVEAQWSIITRDDGSKQWVYKGKQLYVWSKDQKPGDMTGDGFNGIWHIVKD